MKLSKLAVAGRPMSTTAVRALIGFFVAPGVPALALYVIGSIFVSGWEAEFWPVVFAIAGYLAALFFGVPAYLLLQRKDVHSLNVYLVLGALIGMGCYALFFVLSTSLSWQSHSEHALSLLKNSVNLGLVAVVYATVASVVFWLIAIKGNEVSLTSR